jgi:DNA-binding MarR family transcriptional regulator
MDKSWFTHTEVYLLHEIVARLDRLARQRVLDARGISYAEFLVAMAVREIGTPTQAEVGALLDVSKSLVSQRVATLLAKDVLAQQRDPANRRQVRLALTDAGARTLEQIYQELAAQAAALFETLGPGRAGFMQALRDLQHRLAEADAPPAETSDKRG